MRARVDSIESDAAETDTRVLVIRAGAGVAVGLLVALIAPVLAFAAGVLVLVVVAAHTFSADLRPILDPVLRIPVADAKTRYSHLAAFVSTGVALILVGTVSVTMRGSMSSASEQREAHRSAAAASVDMLIDRARDRIAIDIVPAAEVALLDALAVADLDPSRRDEINELLERIQRSGDSEAIRAVVDGLSEDDLLALKSGKYVPEALDFGEPALTRRAVASALEVIERRQRK